MQVLVGCLSLSMLLRPPLPHARISCITRCPPIVSCDSSAAFPDLTLEKLRTTSMDDLEELVEEMEAELANVKDASGVVDIQLSRLLAVAHTCYGDSDIAEEHATAVLEAGEPDAEMLFVRGLAAERRDAQDEALDAYEACLDADPKFWRALFHVGKISLAFGWPADAVEYFRQVAEINPEHAPTQAFIARLDEADIDVDKWQSGDLKEEEDTAGDDAPPSTPDLPDGINDVKL